MMNRLTNIKPYATINKSIITILSPANLYRFFCLSLFRDDFYNVRIRLKDLAQATNEKESTLKNFNKDIKDVVQIKKYYLPSPFPNIEKIKRNIYNIPPIDKDFITLSAEFIYLDLDVKVKGYYIKLLFFCNDNKITLSKSKLATELGTTTKTIEKYNAILKEHYLLNYFNEIKLPSQNLLLNNYIAEQKRYSIKIPRLNSLQEGLKFW